VAPTGRDDASVAGMLGLKGLRRANRHERAGFALYGVAVAAARERYLYEALGVPDTLDGRFDLISLYAFLLIHRLRGLPDPGAALAQAVFDAMFSDMDMNLRELGVGDLSVGKRVRAMWEAFHGRANV
jgi:cytochrome b pre-mRNA-processing protein 3